MHLRTLKNARKWHWVIGPDYCASHPRRFWAVGDDSRSKIWRPSDWLWDACHMAGVRWGSRCKGFCSKEGPHYCFEQSKRNTTMNLIHEFGNPLGIPYPSCTVQLIRAYVTRESVSLRIFVSKKGMIRVRLMDLCTRNLRQKAESILLQETHACSAWNMGAHVQHTRGIDFFRSKQKCSNCSNSAMVRLVHVSGYSDRSHVADPGIIYLFSQK